MAAEQQKKNPARYIGTSDAAQQLGVDPSTMFAWRQKNTGPQYYRFGGRVLYALEDIEAYIRNSRVETQQ